MGRVRDWLPTFPLWNSYTSAMIGDHVVAIIAESYVKGVINLTEADYQLMKRNATNSPATYAEYAYDDFALAQVAQKMGKTDDYAYFLKRAQNFRNVFDPKVNNMNGRFANGDFTKEFDRNKMLSFVTEGTPWQYSWYVPHDPEGLIELMGGTAKFNQTLDAFFAEGQYWHGNEPGQQIPFLYNFQVSPGNRPGKSGIYLKPNTISVLED